MAAHRRRNWSFPFEILPSLFLIAISIGFLVIDGPSMPAAIVAILTAIALLTCITRQRRLRRNAIQVRLDAQPLLLLIESLPDHALFSTDGTGTITAWNQGAQRLFGHTHDDVFDRPLHKLLTGGVANVDWMRQALAMSLAFGRYEDRRSLKRADGSTFEAVITLSVIVRPDGVDIGHAVLAQDITERLRLDEHIRRMERMDAIGHVTAGVAHDFNNLLQSQIIGLQLLQDELDPDGTARELAGIALHAAEQAARLTDQLLMFSRQKVLTPVPIVSDAVVTDVLALARLTNSMTRSAPTDPATPVALADRSLLETALLNLIINATDASNGLTPIIVGACKPPPDWTPPVGLAAGTDHAVFWVSDSGSGMTPEVIARASEPFFTTKGALGSGLGLSMVQGFARQSGGDIAIRSTIGVGTRVEIWLPTAESLAAEPARAATRPLRPANIVLVDDQPDVLMVLGAVLEANGFVVTRHESGEAALADLERRGGVDLLISDVAMPGLDGIALARRVRRAGSEPPILLITGYPDAAALADPPEGVTVLAKPFRKEDLLRRIAEILPP